MNDTFTLSQSQLAAAKENGLICEHFGPVEGTKDIFHVKPNSLQNLVTSCIRMGRQLASTGGIVVKMKARKTA